MEEYEKQIEAMDEYTYQWKPENMDDPNEPILKITKSSLGSFNWCPKKYEFSYVERRPQDQSEAMRKGTIMHNSREQFFIDFDIKKAETMNTEEVIDYCSSLFPIDDYFEDYQGIAIFEAQRFIEARTEKKLDEYLPVVNEGKFDCEIMILADTNPKFPLSRDYKIHLQGIIDRIFMEDGGLIPMEFKTGGWKDYKTTSMRQEMAFYQLMIENCSPEVLKQTGINEVTPVTHWAWYYPIANHFYVEPVKKSSMKSVMNKIAMLIHSYEQGIFNAKYFYKTCAHCSFFPICDKAQEDSWL
tara:strand:+ start:311 stop:1207 length:897 start_codon:yes stop_codon:yes gene_type:complete